MLVKSLLAITVATLVIGSAASTRFVESVLWVFAVIVAL